MAPSEHGIDSPWLYGYTVDWNDPGDKRCCSRCYVKTAFCPRAARPKALHEQRWRGPQGHRPCWDAARKVLYTREKVT